MLPALREPRIARNTLDKEPASLIPEALVGLGRFELPTSRLSGVRSNQLSYRPRTGTADSLETRQRKKFNDRPSRRSTVHPSRLLASELPQKGGDPATGSPTATLLRLHPNRCSYHGRLPPEG
jgi:hypothetical protein